MCLFKFSVNQIYSLYLNTVKLNRFVTKKSALIMADSLGFECIAKVIADGDVQLFKYKSKRTGLTVCIAETEGPLVGGHLCVATKAYDDDGLAHTLEHLVFLGSEKYPYKSVLDLLANRCLASGTNAWTDTDHTCYTMTTAGSEGFLTLLPIYLDHLLYPTLSKEAYVTEVHHINGEGEDAGVVYCEMQARENTGESLSHMAMIREMYPGDCGYNVEHGGTLKNLRESTSSEKVKAFHKKYYRAENLCIIIVGKIKAENVFESLQSIEDRILQDEKKELFSRPWMMPIPPLLESVTKQIEYPNDEEDSGMLISAWRGPVASDCFNLVAIEILMDYLTDTSVSPLNRELVEIDDAFCNDVDYTVIENYVSCIYLYLCNVPVEKLEQAQNKLFSVFENIANGKEEIDMKRITTLINKKKLHILSSMEDSPHDLLAGVLISDFLYGDGTSEHLETRLQEIPILDMLAVKTSEFWLDLLKNYIVHGKYVVILGRPSIKLSESMAEEEKLRIKEQQVQLGPDGLKGKAELLKMAVEKNNLPVPNEVITSVSVPSVKSIQFHPIQTLCNVETMNNTGIEFAVEQMPCRFQLNDINTNFVRITVFMDTSDLSPELRMYLPLFIELLDECAVQRNGEIIPYQEIVKELEKDTIHISTNLGLSSNRFFCGSYAQGIFLKLMVQEEKYARSVQWVREMLFNIVFEAPRLKSIIKKIVNDLPSLKRDSSSVSKSLLTNILFQKGSNHWISSMFRQASFLNTVLKKLNSNPSQIINDLNQLRENITQPTKMAVHLSLNMKNFEDRRALEEPWNTDLLPSNITPSIVKCSIKGCHEFLLPCSADRPSGLIVGVSATETADLIQCAPCMNSYTDPDYASLILLVQYLTQSEGLLYKKVRGSGLAYGCGLYLNPMTGLIYLHLYESSHLVKGYEVIIECMESILKGEYEWETEMVVSAKSSLMFEHIDNVKTVADVSFESLKQSFSNLSVGFVHELLEKISKVNISDMEHATKYLKPLFDVSMSRCSVCCHPDKTEEIVKGFQKFSRHLVKLPSLEDDILSAF